MPLAPARLLDTQVGRAFQHRSADRLERHPHASRSPAAAVFPSPAAVLAMALNVTATRTQGSGYLTGWPANTPLPGDVDAQLRVGGADRGEPRHHRAERRRRELLQLRRQRPARRPPGLLDHRSTAASTRCPADHDQHRGPAGDDGRPAVTAELRPARVPVRLPGRHRTGTGGGTRALRSCTS